MELKQNRLTDRRSFRLEADSIWIKISTPKENIETKIKYSDLGLGTVIIRKKRAAWFFMVMAILSLTICKFMYDKMLPDGIIGIFLFLIPFILTFVFFVFLSIDSSKTLIEISDGQKSFAFLKNIPSAEAVDEFITELKKRITKKIIDLNIRPNDPSFDLEFKISQLQYLLDSGTIDQAMFDEIELSLKNQNKRSIGYRKNS